MCYRNYHSNYKVNKMKTFLIAMILSVFLFAGLAAQDMTNIEKYRLHKMAEYLELTPEQGEAFFPLLRQYERQMAELAEQENKLYEEIKERKGKNDVSREELDQIMQRVNQFEQQRTELKQRFMNQSGNVLSPGQTSRIPFFEKQFRNDLKREYMQRQNPVREKSGRRPLIRGRGNR